MKTCSKCHALKPYSDYNKDSSKPDGYYSSCKSCKLVKDYKWVKNNPDKVAAKQKRYYSTEKGKIMARKSVKLYRERHPEKRLAHNAVEQARQRKKNPLVKPNNCENCGTKTDVYGHHYKGYTKEYRQTVIWLCRTCHDKAHS